MILLREIAALIAEQQKWYREYVLPNAAEARMRSPMSKFSGKGSRETAPLDLKVADSLGDSPSDRFAKGQAHVEHLSARISALRRQEAKIAQVVMAPPRSQIDWTARLERQVSRPIKEDRTSKPGT